MQNLQRAQLLSTISMAKKYKRNENYRVGRRSRRKSGYEHFMLKEIHEQPKVIKDTINSVLTDGNISFESVGLSDEDMKNIQQVYIVACGSAYHVGMVAQYVIEELTSLSVRVELASEFRYRQMKLAK